MSITPASIYPWYIPFDKVGVEVFPGDEEQVRQMLFNSLSGRSLEFLVCIDKEVLIELLGQNDADLLIPIQAKDN
jgi:hypothetical protein